MDAKEYNYQLSCLVSLSLRHKRKVSEVLVSIQTEFKSANESAEKQKLHRFSLV